MIIYNENEAAKQAEQYFKIKQYNVNNIVRESYIAGFRKGIETQLTDETVKIEWISVTDGRYPSDLERVQVLVRDDTGDNTWYYVTIGQYIGTWIDGEDYIDVIAWMPNAKVPPKEVLRKLSDMAG